MQNHKTTRLRLLSSSFVWIRAETHFIISAQAHQYLTCLSNAHVVTVTDIYCNSTVYIISETIWVTMHNDCN